MRTLLMAMIAMMLAAPAYAQGMGGGHRQQRNEKAEPAKPKVDEKAYRAALEKIPEPKGKVDPWAKMR